MPWAPPNSTIWIPGSPLLGKRLPWAVLEGTAPSPVRSPAGSRQGLRLRAVPLCTERQSSLAFPYVLKWFGEAFNESLGADVMCQPLPALHWEVVGQRTCRVRCWEAAPAQLGGLSRSEAGLGRCWGKQSSSAAPRGAGGLCCAHPNGISSSAGVRSGEFL